MLNNDKPQEKTELSNENNNDCFNFLLMVMLTPKIYTLSFRLYLLEGEKSTVYAVMRGYYSLIRCYTCASYVNRKECY